MAVGWSSESFFRKVFSGGKKKTGAFPAATGAPGGPRDQVDPNSSYGKSLSRGALGWLPFTSDYELRKVEISLGNGDQARNRGDRQRASFWYQEVLTKLENLKETHLNPAQSEIKSYLQSYAHWMLADLFLAGKDWDRAKEHLDLSQAIRAPQTSREYSWLGRCYLLLGHGFLEARRRADALATYVEAAKFKPSLDGRANEELAKEWADQGRTDREALRKYLQCVKPEEWIKGRFRTVIYQGCKIDPDRTGVAEDLRDKIIFNQRILAIHDHLDWAHRNLAHGYLLQGECGKSRDHFDRARKIKGEIDPQVYQDYTFWMSKAAFFAKDYQGCAQELASVFPQQISPKFRREYELYSGLSMAHALFDQQGGTSTPYDLGEIETNLTNALDQGAVSAEAQFFLGRIKYIQNSLEEALARFKKAVQADPYNPHYLIKLTDALQAASPTARRGEVKDYLKKAHILLGAEELEADAEVMMTLSNLLQEEGNLREADRWYQRAQRACPQNSLVLLKSSWKQLTGEEFAQAFESAARISSNNEKILREKHFIQGRCSLRLHRPLPEATTWLHQAISLGMDDWESYYWLGISLAHQKQYDKAKDYLIRSLRKKNRQAARTLVQLGDIMLLQGTPEQGIKFFQAAVNLTRKEHLGKAGSRYYQDAFYGLGRCYLGKGEAQRAAHYFAELLQLNDRHAAAHYYLALVYENLGELGRCENLLRQLIGKRELVSGEATAFVGAAYIKLGVLLCRKGNRELLAEAEEMLEQARQLGGERDEVVFYRGLIKVSTGRLAEGYQEWERLQDQNQADKEMNRNLEKVNYLWGMDLFRHGKYAEALRRFEDANGPHLGDWRAEIYFRRGLELVQQNRQEEAGQFLEKAAAIKPQVDAYLLAKGMAALRWGTATIELVEGSFAEVRMRNSDHPLAAFLLGVCNYVQGGDKKELAYRQFGEVIQSAMANGALKELAQLLVAGEDLKIGTGESLGRMLALLKTPEGLAHLPFAPNAFNARLAHTLVKICDGEAVLHAEELARHTPPEQFAYCLALVNSLKGSPEKALEYFQVSYEQDRGNRPLAEKYAGMLCYVATHHLKKDSMPEALACLNRAKHVLAGKAVV